MSKIKPMELISEMSGKVCGHSDTYFANRNGTQYSVKICNPYQGEPTEKQLAVQQKFAQVQAAIQALTEEDKQSYATNFKKQKKYKTLRGYIFSRLYNTME